MKIWLKLFVAVSSFGITITNIIACSQNESNSDNQNKITNPKQPTIPVYPNIPVNPNLPQWPIIPVYPNIPAKEELDKVLLHKEVNGYIATSSSKVIEEVIKLNHEINITEKDIEVTMFVSADNERNGFARLKATKTSKWVGETIISITKLDN